MSAQAVLPEAANRFSQEMERERVAHENEEKEKAEKALKMKEAFGDANGQWEKDKAALQDMALDDKKSGDSSKTELDKQAQEPQGDGSEVEEAAKNAKILAEQ